MKPFSRTSNKEKCMKGKEQIMVEGRPQLQGWPKCMCVCLLGYDERLCAGIDDCHVCVPLEFDERLYAGIDYCM